MPTLTPHDLDPSGFVAAFGVPVTVRGQIILGIFSNSFEEADTGAQFRLSANAPRLTITQADYEKTNAAVDDTIDVAGTEYIIKPPVEPDGFDSLVVLNLIESA